MKRVATSIVEVRDGRVLNYQGDYDSYLYSVNQEITAGEREVTGRQTKPGKTQRLDEKSARSSQVNDRQLRKELANVEKAIARFTEQKAELNSQLLQTTDPAEALRLHNNVTNIAQNNWPSRKNGGWICNSNSNAFKLRDGPAHGLQLNMFSANGQSGE